jgi:ATP adenylyltransferase
MTYIKLVNFIQNRMKMSHIYQPVMLMTLLVNRGQSSEREIAKSILTYDESQLEYYEKVTRNMVGRVLRSHGVVERDGKTYRLVGHQSLSEEEVSQLISLCQAKLDEFITKRGERIFQHRKLSSGYISGTLWYEVLKRAQFHCELCGIPADVKALEVDHILPRNPGGTDDLSNLQALCYSCNSMKRDRDDTDFRKVKESYKHRDKDCTFCESSDRDVIGENELAYAIYDKYPVTDLHTLIIPKRHVDSYFELSRPENNACNDLLRTKRQMIQEKDTSVRGFNIGMYHEEVAGQTIFHCHIHLIPRRVTDVENPRGGTSHLMPNK